jgi:hypothetical protein
MVVKSQPQARLVVVARALGVKGFEGRSNSDVSQVAGQELADSIYNSYGSRGHEASERSDTDFDQRI